MKILIDTNVIMDVLAKREPFYTNAKIILNSCDFGDIKGVIAGHSITNLFYILRKYFERDEIRKILLNLCKAFQIESVDRDKIISSLENKTFNDIEDCLQMECAISGNVDYIITRNKKDFLYSSVPCLTPEEFCNKFSLIE